MNNQIIDDDFLSSDDEVLENEEFIMRIILCREFPVPMKEDFPIKDIIRLINNQFKLPTDYCPSSVYPLIEY